tara:strand:+ start:583 stop:927 length:345 start_codon:yes stop_codon:yes gene_type:complete
VDMENMGNFGESLGLNMWMGVVPASEILPAISFVHVSDTRARTQDGSIGGKANFWELIVVANSYASAQQEADKIRNVDNGKSAFYKTFHVNSEQLLLPDEGDSIVRIAMDIKTT